MGLVKRKKGMNYEKLSRALRFYYGQGIIQKVGMVTKYWQMTNVLTCYYKRLT